MDEFPPVEIYSDEYNLEKILAAYPKVNIINAIPFMTSMQAFQFNILRAWHILMTPVRACLLGQLWSMGSIHSRLDMSIPLNENIEPGHPRFDEITQNSYKIMDDQFKALRSNITLASNVRAKAYYTYGKMLKRYYAIEYDSSILSMLHSAIAIMWTSFETFATDLWIAVLNEHAELGFMALNADITEADDHVAAEEKMSVRFELPIWKLKEYNFDIKYKMGSLLESKWDFARRPRMIDAYVSVFRDIKKELKQLFSEDKLRWLNALRNAIVHNGGRADAEFVKIVAKNSYLNIFGNSQVIRIDGAFVADYNKYTTDIVERLATTIHTWLSNKYAHN